MQSRWWTLNLMLYGFVRIQMVVLPARSLVTLLTRTVVVVRHIVVNRQLLGFQLPTMDTCELESLVQMPVGGASVGW
jgi:hypothetical protein